MNFSGGANISIRIIVAYIPIKSDKGITLRYWHNTVNNYAPRGKKHPCNKAREDLTRHMLDWIDNG